MKRSFGRPPTQKIMGGKKKKGSGENIKNLRKKRRTQSARGTLARGKKTSGTGSGGGRKRKCGRPKV